MKANLTQISLLLLSTLAPLAAGTPSGWIASSSNFVRANTTVELDWEITVPSRVAELVNYENPEKEIRIRENLTAEVKVLGSAIGASTNPLYSHADVHAGNSGWNVIYSGWANGLAATSTNSYWLTEGQTLDFVFKTWLHSSRFLSQSDWGPLLPTVSTGTGDDRLIILKNGDPAPSYNGLYDQDGTAAFVAPYLAADGETVQIPDNSLLIFAELDYRVNSSSDFQDFVVLVNFISSTNNGNHHGWRNGRGNHNR